MLQLYSAGGSSEIELGPREASAEEWADSRLTVVRLLRARGQAQAAEFLATTAFEVYEATNTFGDQFSVLYLAVSPEEYVQYETRYRDPEFRTAVFQLAQAAGTLLRSTYVRFVVVDVRDEQHPTPVPSSAPRVTSAVVEAALADAEHLLSSRGPTSALDRVHTAFHGYLHALAQDAAIPLAPDASITQVFRELRRAHPVLRTIALDPEAQRVLNAIATVIDALNTVRNRRSLAHPNDALLGSPEAMLMINSVRTLLRFVDDRVSATRTTESQLAE